MAQRRAGLIQLQINGEIESAKGNFTYGLGAHRREAIIGSDGIHGYLERPQVGFIEGEITDRGDLDLRKIFEGKDVTVTLALANEKVVVLRDAWFAGEGVGNTNEANIAVRWEGASAEEVL